MNISLAIIYSISTVIAGLVMWDFWRARDGELRKILVQLFAVIAFNYLSSVVMILSSVNMDVVYSVRSIVVIIQMVILLRLYYYIKWKP